MNTRPVLHAAYLFDLDGTLVDTAPDIDRALNHALSEFGCPPVAESLTRHWIGFGSRVLIGRALDEQGRDHAVLEPMIEHFLDHYRHNLARHSRPYPGVCEALERLHGTGCRLGVVTNKLTELTLPLLSSIGLRDWFHVVVCGDTAEAPKPDPAPVRFACRTLGPDPADTLFVGDSTTDVTAARRAGCPVVCVSYGYNQGTPPAELGADAIVDSLLELV